jgi:hypothetical protein
MNNSLFIVFQRLVFFVELNLSTIEKLKLTK